MAMPKRPTSTARRAPARPHQRRQRPSPPPHLPAPACAPPLTSARRAARSPGAHYACPSLRPGARLRGRRHGLLAAFGAAPGGRAGADGSAAAPPPPPYNGTRLVHPSVLNGHVSSLSPIGGAAAARDGAGVWRALRQALRSARRARGARGLGRELHAHAPADPGADRAAQVPGQDVSESRARAGGTGGGGYGRGTRMGNGREGGGGRRRGW